MSNTVTYSSQDARAAQQRYCEEHNLPHFAPYTGRCFRCGQDIYSKPYGYSVEDAGERLITRCPHCMASYVD